MHYSLKETFSKILNFRLTATRQNGHHGIEFMQTQLPPRCSPVWLHGNNVGQRVANVSGGNAVPGQQSNFKRKNTQHVVNAAADCFNTVGAPGPDGRADEMHGFYAFGF